MAFVKKLHLTVVPTNTFANAIFFVVVFSYRKIFQGPCEITYTKYAHSQQYREREKFHCMANTK